MEIVLRETPYVAGLLGRSGDPSPFTARGVFRAIQASTRFLWKTDSLSGLTVALQGCGHVGYNLAKLLREAGAYLMVSDVNARNSSRVIEEFGAELVQPDELDVQADVFAPCALGGVINDETIRELKVSIVAGAANNQLLEERHGEMLRERKILYAPDYVANAGGVLNGSTELLGWKPEDAARKINEIYDTILRIYESAQAQGISTNKAADQLAEERLKRN
jgi:leucine dehydrogenase